MIGRSDFLGEPGMLSMIMCFHNYSLYILRPLLIHKLQSKLHAEKNIFLKIENKQVDYTKVKSNPQSKVGLIQ